MDVAHPKGGAFNSTQFFKNMSRYTGPTTRINRRFGMAIFPANKSFERRTYPPGQHGPNFRRKASDYSVGLMEKQKLRMMYGLTEKQFRNLFQKAKTRNHRRKLFIFIRDSVR